jgi:outer membrane receptor protein involved in Fe transport
MPGVDNSKDSPWEQRPVLRGLGGQRVLVLVDGMPMNSARGNGPHPSLVGPSQIDRVEVVRGPSSVAYGSDALGGVINIITREANFLRPDQTFRGSAAIGGSTADEQGNLFLELMKRTGKLSAYVSTGGRNAQDYRSANGDVPNSKFSEYDALANLRWDFTEKTALKLGWQLYRGDDIGIPGLSFAFPGASQDFGFNFYNRDYTHLTLSHAHTSSWLAATQIKAYWQQERRNFDSDQDLEWFMFPAFGFPAVGPPSGPGDTASVATHQDRYFDISTFGLQGQLTSVRTSRTLFTAGIDAARDITDGDNVRFRTYEDPSGASIGGTAQRVTASIPDGDFDNYGAYAQSEWYAHPRWTLHAGGRFTHYRYRTDEFVPAPGSPATPPMSVDDDALSGSAGVVWSPVRDLHLSGNVANGYREPNAQDLFFNGPASVGNVLGNPDLVPEKSVSYDLGLRWGPGRLGLAANAFYSTYEDLIDALPVPGPPGPPTFQYTNVSEARIWGYEVEGEWKFRPQWNARANVSDAIGDITNAEAIQNLYGVAQDQAPLPSVPPIHGTFSVRWSDARSRLWLEPSARWSWRTSRPSR